MFQPTRESITAHRVPAWYDEGKLGIFIHWGLYSVPAWAPPSGPLPEVVERDGWAGWFMHNPYAEWYSNTMRIEGSPTMQYHAAHYPTGFGYEDFAPQFNAGLGSWNPENWANLFKRAGARYVVLTTKHHDGFTLWPSRHQNPTRVEYQASRDLFGELTKAVRAQGLKMGAYYSGGLDWTFNSLTIRSIGDLFRCIPQQPAYVSYAGNQIRELIERYAPSILWGDIGYPTNVDLLQLFAEYYNAVPEGLINDRFGQVPSEMIDSIADNLEPGMLPLPVHFDIRTPEYSTYPTIQQQKWECTRGLGYSFGYNRNETEAELLSKDELIHSFIDIVSKNGNLIINVGPQADGSISADQQERLLALGEWLSHNGEAIYGSQPWERAESQTTEGVGVRFTQRDGHLYAIVLGAPTSTEVTIRDLALPASHQAALLGHEGSLPWGQQDGQLTVSLPQPLRPAAAFTIRFSAS